MIIKVKLFRKENLDYYGTSEIEINIEDYLKGVVPAEIGNAHIEACAAQAIAARNYTLYKIKTKGYITDQSSTDQAFRSSRLTGYPNAYEGVNKTLGQILYYNNRLAQCYYSNSNGGRTTSCDERWGGASIPYLISKTDSFDTGSGNGHGVGLSQVGAANRAKAGQTYQQILAFYFPGTILKEGGELTMETTVEQFILNWLKDKVGSPYIYGATQQKCTPQYRRDRQDQYPDYAQNIKDNCQVLSGKSGGCAKCKWYDNVNNQPKYAYDCAQLVRWAAKSAGLDFNVSGATSQWKSDSWQEKGQYAAIPNNKLCCVFRDKNGTKEHVGWYYNGEAYHARGHAYGVVKTNNSQYKAWTHYAIMKGIYDINGKPIKMGAAQEPVPLPNPTKEVLPVLYQARENQEKYLNIRKEPSTKAAAIGRVEPCDVIDVINEVNSEWAQIIYKNMNGYVMRQYIDKMHKSPAYEYYIKIKCGSEEDARFIAKALQGTTVVEEEKQ